MHVRSVQLSCLQGLRNTNKNGYPIRRMVLAEQEARIFFVINKVLPNFRRNSRWHDSLCNGRHGGV